MVTNIQVRAVDDALARAAKARAEASHRSLSAYIRDLIKRDLEGAEERRAMQALLAEIAGDPAPAVSREATAAALAQARRDLGTA